MPTVKYRSKKTKRVLDKYGKAERDRVLKKIKNTLSEYSHKTKNIKHITDACVHRFRIGQWRIFFLHHVDENVIEITDIERRDKAYR